MLACFVSTYPATFYLWLQLFNGRLSSARSLKELRARTAQWLQCLFIDSTFDIANPILSLISTKI